MKPKMILSLWAVFVLTTGVAVAAQHPKAIQINQENVEILRRFARIDEIKYATGKGGESAVVKQTAVSLSLDRPLISIALKNREELGLSHEQVRKLRSLRSQFQKGEILRRADLRVQEIELDELLATEPLDISAVEARVKRIEAVRSDGRLSRIRTLMEGRALLTPEQREKLVVLRTRRAKEGLERHRGPHSGGMEGMMGGRRGGMHGMMRGMRQGMVSGCPGMMSRNLVGLLLPQREEDEQRLMLQAQRL